MSRFQSPSPRFQRTESLTSSTAAEDEIINSILKKRQGRNPPRRSPEAGSESVISISSHTHEDQPREANEPTMTPRHAVAQDTLPAKTPYALLKRLANAAPIRGDNNTSSPFKHLQEDYAESYVSHTSNSIREASALLGQAEEQTPASQNLSLLAISRMMAKEKAQGIDAETFPSGSFTMNQSLSTPEEVPENKVIRPNRTLFTPQERPRSREVAEGYISPPQSRQTSPELLLSGSNKPMANISAMVDEPQQVRNSYAEISPSPRLFRKLSPSFQHKMAIPSRVIQDTTTNSSTGSSPRSRLTRTLIEIQSELAESREGIESIESRLEVLEQHASVDRDMLQKHVEDCIKSMANELDDSSDVMEDSFQPDVNGPEGVNDVQPQGQDILRVAESPLHESGTILRLPISAKAILYGMAAALATEWVVMTILGELGRRQVLTMS